MPLFSLPCCAQQTARLPSILEVLLALHVASKIDLDLIACLSVFLREFNGREENGTRTTRGRTVIPCAAIFLFGRLSVEWAKLHIYPAGGAFRAFCKWIFHFMYILLLVLGLGPMGARPLPGGWACTCGGMPSALRICSLSKPPRR